MSTLRGSNFPWTALPRRMTPKPMPSWIAPEKNLVDDAVGSSPLRLETRGRTSRSRSRADPRHNKREINVLEEDSPELEALRPTKRAARADAGRDDFGRRPDAKTDLGKPAKRSA